MNRPTSINPPETASLVQRLGDRVRAARKAALLSRNALAEQSGVSLRYIAQIEAGQGNASVLLLDRLASSLNLRLPSLLADPSDPDDAVTLAYAAASPETRSKVRTKLGLPNDAERRARRIALIGLRGAGKSTLGARLSKTTGAPFVELNAEIERLSGMPIAELIALYGQEGYRRLEAEAVAEVSTAYESVILAVAGGIVEEARTFDSLLATFHTVWLKASPEEHMERVRAQGDHRPMAGNPAAMKQLRSILTSREQEYARAEFAVDTANRDEDESFSILAGIVDGLRI